MGKIKVYEDENKFIELSDKDAELILCKSFISSENSENLSFIFNNFEERWLSSDEFKSIYKIAKVYWNKYETIPSKELYYKLFKNSKFIENEKKLISEYDRIDNFNISSFDKKYIKNILSTFIKNKAIYFAILDKVEDIQENGEIGDLIERFEKVVQIDLDDNLGIEYFENLDKHCENIEKVEKKLPYGISLLDSFTNGGMPANDTCLIIIMAQPGLGKSTLMANIMHNLLLLNKKVLLASLEMTEEMYSRRIDGLFTGFDFNKLKGRTQAVKSIVLGAKANNPKSQLVIKEFPTGTMSAMMLKQYMAKLKATSGFEPDIIFVDYLNIMRPNSNSPNMSLYEKCARIAEELRAVSSEYKIPVVSAIQSNRQNSGGGGYAGKNIDMSNAAESSGIPATADAMFALFQLEGEREIDRINLKILKNRFGEASKIFPLHFDYSGNSLRITDWNDEEKVNDDVLGEVHDASDKLFNTNVKIKDKDESGFEEL